MNDRHLCKAKRTDNRKWIEGYYAFIGKKHVIMEKTSEEFFSIDDGEDRSGSRILEVDPETVRQYTGLTEVKEKKWENDIFQCDEHTYIIQWSEDDLAWYANEIFEPDYSTALSEFRADEIYVIGNAIDNPELLKGGAE